MENACNLAERVDANEMFAKDLYLRTTTLESHSTECTKAHGIVLHRMELQEERLEKIVDFLLELKERIDSLEKRVPDIKTTTAQERS